MARGLYPRYHVHLGHSCCIWIWYQILLGYDRRPENMDVHLGCGYLFGTFAWDINVHLIRQYRRRTSISYMYILQARQHLTCTPPILQVDIPERRPYAKMEVAMMKDCAKCVHMTVTFLLFVFPIRVAAPLPRHESLVWMGWTSFISSLVPAWHPWSSIWSTPPRVWKYHVSQVAKRPKLARTGRWCTPLIWSRTRRPNIVVTRSPWYELDGLWHRGLFLILLLMRLLLIKVPQRSVS